MNISLPSKKLAGFCFKNDHIERINVKCGKILQLFAEIDEKLVLPDVEGTLPPGSGEKILLKLQLNGESVTYNTAREQDPNEQFRQEGDSTFNRNHILSKGHNVINTDNQPKELSLEGSKCNIKNWDKLKTEEILKKSVEMLEQGLVDEILSLYLNMPGDECFCPDI